MDKPAFLTASVTQGDLNAMVKNIMVRMPDTDDPNEVVRRVNSGEWVVNRADLLKQVATANVGGVERFCAKDSLAEANIGSMNDNFKEFFLGKVEESVGATTIVVHRLERKSLNTLIMAELGDRAEIQLAHCFQLLKAQSNGEQGVLLVNGASNIVYLLGVDNNLRTVSFQWHARRGFWDVLAHYIEDRSGVWLADNQIFSL